MTFDAKKQSLVSNSLKMEQKRSSDSNFTFTKVVMPELKSIHESKNFSQYQSSSQGSDSDHLKTPKIGQDKSKVSDTPVIAPSVEEEKEPSQNQTQGLSANFSDILDQYDHFLPKNLTKKP